MGGHDVNFVTLLPRLWHDSLYLSWCVRRQQTVGGHDINFVAILPRLYMIPLSVLVHRMTADHGWP